MPLSERDREELRAILGGKATGFRYDDLARYLRRGDCIERTRKATSHRVWVTPGGGRVMVRDCGKRTLPPVYAKDVATALLKE